MTNQVLARRDRKLFCKKRVMRKAGIPSSISEETVRKVLQKTDLKWTHFQRKEILTKNDLKLRLKFARKVCRKCAMCNTMKYEIIRKPMVLQRVEINLLKSAHYYYNQNFFVDHSLLIFNEFQRSKWEGLWDLAEIEITW